jgi:hypothetical protein
MNFYFYKKIKDYTFHITVAIILVATVILGGHFALAAETSAVEVNYSSSYLAQAKADSLSNLDKAASIGGIKSDVTLGTRVGTIINGILSIIGVVMLVLFIYGGFTWMTAGGNEEKVRQATKILASAVVGFILIFLSFALTNFFIKAYNKASSGSGGGNTVTTGACLHPVTTMEYTCLNVQTSTDCPSGDIFQLNATCAELCNSNSSYICI